MSEEIRAALQGATVAYVASADDRGQPHLAVSKLIRILDAEHVAFTAWFCPQTAENIAKNPKVAVSVWDAAHDHGYQLVGEVTNATVTADARRLARPRARIRPDPAGGAPPHDASARRDGAQVRHAQRQDHLKSHADMTATKRA